MRSSGPAPGGGWAMMGNHPSRTPNTTSTMTPLTNSGIAVSERPMRLMAVSTGRSSFRPATMPRPREIGTTQIRAIRASAREFWSRASTKGRTGRCRTMESPQRPMTKLPSQAAYLTGTGRSAPS